MQPAKPLPPPLDGQGPAADRRAAGVRVGDGIEVDQAAADAHRGRPRDRVVEVQRAAGGLGHSKILVQRDGVGEGGAGGGQPRQRVRSRGRLIGDRDRVVNGVSPLIESVGLVLFAVVLLSPRVRTVLLPLAGPRPGGPGHQLAGADHGG